MADTSAEYDTTEEWEIFSKKENRPMTLRYLFALTRPDFLVQESTGAGTQWHNDFIEVNFEDIEEWQDFNEGNVNTAFLSAIDHAVPFNENLELPFDYMDHTARIREEKDVDKYFLNVIGPILSHALGHSAGKLYEGTQNPVSLKLRVPYKKDASKVTLPQYAMTNATHHLKKPNFPIYLPAKSMPRLTPRKDIIHVIGDSARIKSLDPTRCFAKAAHYKSFGRNHIGKLAMYTKGAGTCLAFTMTHIGVTVFRFFIVDGTSRVGVQQRTFPWCPKLVASTEENVISGIKAIYVLMVMSLFPEGHAIQERSQLRSLADWPKIK
ncbi:hypothetical protein PFICI_00322 [Pestalotiopsis fici W106-1]|uniref:Uncharacterized protein n=1 Tax=Pestalotiopsis fici (strain W106-1 / CGMCC3.15140) TaxID=1229662 RepID=W3XKF3_PESFW|nr:uncharacterized protein PFICI_00322 [Pestalotiopsis fici W106-1]ETS86494.1 hypothetical protein PFICI_00322 [Pestalotiopsis fici W106-1]